MQQHNLHFSTNSAKHTRLTSNCDCILLVAGVAEQVPACYETLTHVSLSDAICLHVVCSFHARTPMANETTVFAFARHQQ
jgi:lysine/ornithine N-monooxygenase